MLEGLAAIALSAAIMFGCPVVLTVMEGRTMSCRRHAQAELKRLCRIHGATCRRFRDEYTVTINGTSHTSQDVTVLIRFLRDNVHV